MDQLNPATAVVVLAWSQVPAHQLSASVTASYATFDSGFTWHALTDPDMFAVAQFATARQTTYALLSIPYTSGLGPQLIASSDMWRTWRPIDHDIAAVGQHVQSIWTDPTSGAIVAEARDTDTSFQHLWISQNGRVSWVSVQAPQSNYFIARPALRGKTWYACGVRSETGTAAGPYALQCSGDSFRTWQQIPTLNRPTERDFTVTADGSLLAVGDAAQQPTMYRLANGGKYWERLAPLPTSASGNADILFSGDAQVGTLWALPPLTPDLTTISSVFVAAYP